MRLPQWIVLALFGLVASSPFLFAGERRQEAPEPVSALIVTLHLQPGDVGRLPAIRVADAEKLAQLEGFFPNYRQRPTSRLAGAWRAGHQVYFNFPDGRSIRVTVSQNDNGSMWSVGQGDFTTRGNFPQFVAQLQEEIDAAWLSSRVLPAIEEVVYGEDGGSTGIAIAWPDGSKQQFAFDGRQRTDTPLRIYLGALHPAHDGVERADPTTERRLVAALERVIKYGLSQEERQRLEGAKTMSGLSEREVRHWGVINVLRNYQRLHGNASNQ